MSKVKTNTAAYLRSYVIQTVKLLESTEDIGLQDKIYQKLIDYSLANNDTWDENFLSQTPINQSLLDKFRCLRADYVYAIESEWARKIIASKASIESLEKVSYFKNYRSMVGSEFNFINEHSKQPIKKVAFVGSGPFPFTSFCLAKDFGLRVVNVDIDGEALKTSMELADKFGVAQHMDYLCCDARNMQKDYSCDAIIVAALVGHHAEDKHDIINSLAKSLGANQLIAARTALGLKQLFYVGVSQESVNLRYIGINLATQEIINSLMLFEKP